jgi:succinate dehydrogenase / fumarate reductase cytochrome b subunit
MSQDKKNTKKSRPISPHLSIYKPQISSMLSIGHRLSGVGLFFALAAFCWWFTFFVFSKFAPCYLEIFDYSIVKAILVIASYGFFYHVSTGVRHLVWDTGRWFSIPAINASGWGAVIFSIILTAVFWLGMLGLFV